MSDVGSEFVDRIFERATSRVDNGAADAQDILSETGTITAIEPSPPAPLSPEDAVPETSFRAWDWDVVGRVYSKMRSTTARYPTMIVFIVIFVSLLVLTPPYVQDPKTKKNSPRNTLAATILFTAIFKIVLDRFVLGSSSFAG